MGAKILPTGAYHVPITILGIWETSVDKTDKMPCLRGTYILTRDIKHLRLSATYTPS